MRDISEIDIMKARLAEHHWRAEDEQAIDVAGRLLAAGFTHDDLAVFICRYYGHAPEHVDMSLYDVLCPGCGAIAGGADDDHLARRGICAPCWEWMRGELENGFDEPDGFVF